MDNEIKRRTGSVSPSPNDAVVSWLVRAVLLEQDELQRLEVRATLLITSAYWAKPRP